MEINKNKLIIFGAGKIGRSFIGQLFSAADYEVIFIDIDKKIIGELNCRRSYTVVIKSIEDEIIKVENVSGILASNESAVIDSIVDCRLIATCVGKNVLPKIIPLIAKGVGVRYAEKPDSPIDIILAENIRGGSNQMRKSFSRLLPHGFPVVSYIGLIETSIGKMVPIMPKEIEGKDPLLVYAEPYNTLIVGEDGFKNPIPEIKGLSAKKNIKAWVDRKAFIHNLGHAATAYTGFFFNPDATYIYEVLADEKVYYIVRQSMLQSAHLLAQKYPNEFTLTKLERHIDNLLFRFQNKALKDTIFRVGQDRLRKLDANDRFVGIIRLAEKQGLQYDMILNAMVYAFYFHAKDENGYRSNQDILFEIYKSKGLIYVLKNVCGFNPINDKNIIVKFIESYTNIFKQKIEIWNYFLKS